MKLYIRIALLATLLAVIVHGYLTFQYYPLKFGMGGGESLCNINETFNCDAVSASRYSSFLGIPISVWGGITNLVLFIMILFSWLRLTNHPRRLLRWSLVLAGSTALASVIMGVISVTSLGAYCAFCIGLYILSFISFGALIPAQEESLTKNIGSDFKTLVGESKSILIAFIAIPVLAYITHQSILKRYGADQINSTVKGYTMEWKTNPQNNFQAPPALTMGPERDRAEMTIVEFADFRCGHCKHAAPSLHAFATAHPDVRFEFYNFPLDGECNPAITRGDGVSCRLAKSVYCAAQQNQGWTLSKHIFTQQAEFQKLHSTNQVDDELRELAKPLNYDANQLINCMDSQETHKVIQSQAEAGQKANVKGTPTIYVNGRKLPGGQLIPVLENVYQSL